MLIGPVLTRELVTAPRRLRFYAGRAVYAAGLVALVATAWLLLTGTQEVRNIGDMARFGATLFQISLRCSLLWRSSSRRCSPPRRCRRRKIAGRSFCC